MLFPLSLTAWIILAVAVIGVTIRGWAGSRRTPSARSAHGSTPAGLLGVLFGVGGGATLIETAGTTSLSFLLLGAVIGGVVGMRQPHSPAAAGGGGVRLALREAHAQFGGLASAAILLCAIWMGGRAMRQSLEALDNVRAGTTWAAFALATCLAAFVAFDLRRRGDRRRPWTTIVWLVAAAWVAILGAAVSATDGGISRLRGLLEQDLTMDGIGPLAGLAGVAASFGLLRGLTIAWPWLNTFAGPDGPRPQARTLRSAAAISVAVTFMGGAAVVGGDVSPYVEITDRPASSTKASTLLLGPVHARGLLPNVERGQLIVLPEDTPLAENRRYPVRFQAPPRGAKVGRLEGRKGWVRVPDWEILRDVTHVWFRMKEPEHAQLPSWDLRIPVVRELVRGTVSKPNSSSLQVGEEVEAVVLRPADPAISFAILASQMDGPYIPMKDLHIVATTARATNARYGDFIAMYEERPEGAPLNPSLREAISLGLSGPFFDTTPGEPPFAISFVSAEGVNVENGEVIRLTTRPLRRGLKIGKVLKTQSMRELATPRWQPLAAVRFGRLRHDEDPSKDILFPVSRRLAKDGTFRFTSLNSRIKIGSEKTWRGYSGPYLEVPSFDVEVEVHGDARLPTSLATRHALVPRDTTHAPVSPVSSDPFQPHPAELQVAGFDAPVLTHEGAGWLTRVVSTRLGESAAWLFTLCTALLLGLAVGVSLAAVHPGTEGAPAETRRMTSLADPSVVVPLVAISWTLGFARAEGALQAWGLVDSVALAGFFLVAACALLGMTRRPRGA